MIKHPALQSAVFLALFAIVGTGLVSVIHTLTEEKILQNQRQALLRNLYALVPIDTIDNAIDQSMIDVSKPQLLGGDTTHVYLGFKHNSPVAAVYETLVTNGYSGKIQLLVAVKQDGTLGGVRVINHKETPGLGDKIELKRSDWVLGFNGKSLSNPKKSHWTVKRDGGEFDQFTGATITPRAIVGGVKRTLMYHQTYADQIFKNYRDQHTTKGEKHD